MLILASKIPPKTKLSSFVSRAEIGKLFLETEGNELKILQLTANKFGFSLTMVLLLSGIGMVAIFWLKSPLFWLLNTKKMLSALSTERP